MTILKRLLSMWALLALAACGGGGSDAGTCAFCDGGGSGGTVVAADITLALSASSLSNSGSETITATVTAVDANRNTVAGIPVSLSVDSDATISVSGRVTSATGVVTGTVGIGPNRTNRTILVTATSGSLSRQVALQVVGTRLTATALPAVLAPSEAGKVQYRLVDTNGSALKDIAINIIGVGGAQSAGVTGANGDYEYAFTAPATAVNLDIRATAGGVEVVTTVIVQSGPGSIPSVPAGSVRSASVSVNPSVVPVNVSVATSNRAEVRALFVGDSNAPIQNVRVRFDLAGDANSIGGGFTTGTSVVYSDANGTASTAYVPGSRFSPTDGVTIRACWDYVDFAVGACPRQATATLTVISEALSVSIGTDELIVTPDLSYVKRFVVQVNDSSGLAKPGVVVSPLLDLPSYSKGFWSYNGSVWVKTTMAAECGNEDVNRNGVLEIYSNGHREDANSNLRLDPRKADVLVAFEGSNLTNASGQVILRLTYLRNVASWVTFNLTVAASGVSGTEGRASYSSLLPVPADAVTAATAPAFAASPYGVFGSPRTVVSTPDGSASASLCTSAD